MPKAYSVKPKLRNGKSIFSATFYTASKKRKTGSLGTAKEDVAKMICEGLVVLQNSGTLSLEDSPATVAWEAKRIYFELKDNDATPEEGLLFPAAEAVPAMAATRAEMAKFPKEAQATALMILLDRYKTQQELANLKRRHEALKEKYDAMEKNYNGLKHSTLAQVAESVAGMPSLADALMRYEKDLSRDTTRESTKTHVALAKKFIGTLPEAIKSAAQITPDQIGGYLTDETMRIPTKPKARYRNLRIRLARFINWSAKLWRYESQMKHVGGVDKDALENERGEIVWHELIAVEAAIKAIEGKDAIYWKALVATLGYAGLQLAELCWLRVQDVTLTETGGTLWITQVEDSTGARHALKTSNRKRHVNIHGKYLLQRLKDYIAADYCGTEFFFPMLKTMRKRTRNKTNGVAERWITNTLGVHLRGHAGGKNKKKRPPTPGILPAGMNAQTLRHTFGSLLLRSGKDYHEVATAMGNTAEVVKSFYAKLGGKEVGVDF